MSLQIKNRLDFNRDGLKQLSLRFLITLFLTHKASLLERL